MAKGRGMDDIIVPDRDARWDKYVQRFEFGDTQFHQIRLFGDVTIDFAHTVKTAKGKVYREYCHGWDVDNQKFFSDKEKRCYCCSLEIRGGYRYHMNLIDIEAEENRPAKPKASWTPIRYIDLSSSLFKRLKEYKAVNKGFAISDTERGAIVQIKYDPSCEAASQYAASMDTKNVPITKEQLEYTVIQKYPDGSSKLVHSEDGVPAQYEYIRCINSRDDMYKGLQRNGYYEGDAASPASAAHSFDSTENNDMTRQERVAKVDAEAPVETMDLEMSTMFGKDEDPAPKAEPTKAEPSPKAEPAPKAETPKAEPTPKAAVKKLPSDECPTKFGKYANTLECFTSCPVLNDCRDASGVSKPKEAEVVENDADDDMV